MIGKAKISDERKDTDTREQTSDAGEKDDKSKRWQIQRREG